MTAKRYLFICSLALLFFIPKTYAQGSPDVYKSQADAEVQAAIQLQEEAGQLLKVGITTERMRLAMNLYLRAGQMFEKAANVYKSLGPDYASPDDVKNSLAAMDHCIKMIGEIKKRL
ncbi:MAG: hypothetical protein NC930_01675 [Candidatus Omnitrophica bacterium]|nr:hypothetical protein [Candidatus Omnitrophota bacterium]